MDDSVFVGVLLAIVCLAYAVHVEHTHRNDTGIW